jgi:hypothetical protein
MLPSVRGETGDRAADARLVIVLLEPRPPTRK